MACHEALPTKVGLHIRVSSIDKTCGLCGDAMECGQHAFLGCVFVAGVWEAAGLSWLVEHRGPTFLDWVLEVFCKLAGR